MNVKLLRKVAKHISEEPKRFIMGDVVQRMGTHWSESYDGAVDDNGYQPFPKCGTAACIAGWACVLSEKPARLGTATTLLELEGSFFRPRSQASRLFDASEWPEKFAMAYRSARTPQQRVKTAVARIEHFIKTKGAE